MLILSKDSEKKQILHKNHGKEIVRGSQKNANYIKKSQNNHKCHKKNHGKNTNFVKRLWKKIANLVKGLK